MSTPISTWWSAATTPCGWAICWRYLGRSWAASWTLSTWRRRLALAGIEPAEVLVLVDDAELVAQPRHQGALRESGAGDPRGLGRDRADRLRMKAHDHLHRRNGYSGFRRQYQTYVRVGGQWRYLYRAVDSTGQTIDFLLSKTRDAKAAERFFQKALRATHTTTPRVITVDKNAAYSEAFSTLQDECILPKDCTLRRVKYLNNVTRAGSSVH